MAQIKSGQVVTTISASESASLELGTDTLVGLYSPASLDAQSLGIQASEDNSTFVDIQDGEAALTLPAAPGSYVAVDPTKMLGVRHVRLTHRDSAGNAVNETGDRIFTLMFRSFE